MILCQVSPLTGEQMTVKHKSEYANEIMGLRSHRAFLLIRRAGANLFGLLAAGLGVLAVTVILLAVMNAPDTVLRNPYKNEDVPYTLYTKAGIPYSQQTTLRHGLSWGFGIGIASLVLFAAACVLEIKIEAITRRK